MLSEALRCWIVDRAGQRARLRDLVVDLSTGDYPKVTELILDATGQEFVSLRSDAIQDSQWGRHRIGIANFDNASPAPLPHLEKAVLLKRDVLDALVLDLEHRQATRANDLWISEQDGRLALTGADVRPWAVLRRLGRGVLGHGTEDNLLDWKYVEFLRGDPTEATGRDYHRRVTQLQPAELARLTDALPYLHAAELLMLVPDELAADTLEEMAEERQVQVVEELEERRAAPLLGLMAPNLAVDLLGNLDPALAERLLERLEGTAQERVIDLLQYPPDSAGGIMTNDIVMAPSGLTVADARQTLREQLTQPDFVYFVYVVDDLQSRELRGLFTLRDLLLAEDDRPLDDLMRAQVECVGPLESATEVAQRLADLGLVALPVVDSNRQLLGVVTVDAAMKQLVSPTWRDRIPRVFA